MKREVKIQISGIQRSEEGTEQLNTAAFGYFATLAGKLILRYEEFSESGEVMKTMIKISEHEIVVTKKGDIESEMVFIPGKVTQTNYQTPYGAFLMQLHTMTVQHEQTEDGVEAAIEYQLIIQGELVSVNQLNIHAEFI